MRLHPGREKPLLRRHPWVFSGAVSEVEGNPAPGDVVDVRASDGAWLARAAYSPHSQIRARVLSWIEDEEVDEGFIRDRIARSIARRQTILSRSITNAQREVFSESDELPGLIVDRYDTVRVLQLTTAWADGQRGLLADLFMGLGGCTSVYERSDAEVRTLEGLQPREGHLAGEPVQAAILIEESELRFLVDVIRGHKTGFYLDQRANRVAVAAHAAGRQVLDAFCYSGSFGIACLAAGASHVTFLDSSPSALEQVEAHLDLNALDSGRHDLLQEDVFLALRSMRDRRAQYDMIILDPPKFAATSAQAGKASRAYKDINLLALKLLRPGGLLATFSCSGGVSPALFQKILADAAQDAQVSCRIIERYGQAADHAVALNFPESSYLKGLLVQVD